MAKRVFESLKKIETNVVADSSIPRGQVVMKIHDDDINDVLSAIEPDDELRKLWSDGSKLAVAAATVEYGHKAAAAWESVEKDGIKKAAEKLKMNLNVSSTDDSWSDVKERLDEIYQEVNRQTTELEKLKILYGSSGSEAKGTENNDEDELE